MYNTGDRITIAGDRFVTPSLNIREYASDCERHYFHWQERQGALIARWDNAPHHNSQDTFPHLLHLAGRVMASNAVTLKDVLGEIKTRMGAAERNTAE
ncbi:MAG: hypothetical protein GF344_04690 [Chitinivibrionales bacterium]|nr:hypothetical protein [Chitinivibrionales bacterium]